MTDHEHINLDINVTNADTIYSRGCLDDVASFMVAVEQARKERLAGVR